MVRKDSLKGSILTSGEITQGKQVKNTKGSELVVQDYYSLAWTRHKASVLPMRKKKKKSLKCVGIKAHSGI
jgi:hypothetical protein